MNPPQIFWAAFLRDGEKNDGAETRYTTCYIKMVINTQTQLHSLDDIVFRFVSEHRAAVRRFGWIHFNICLQGDTYENNMTWITETVVDI